MTGEMINQTYMLIPLVQQLVAKFLKNDIFVLRLLKYYQGTDDFHITRLIHMVFFVEQ